MPNHSRSSDLSISDDVIRAELYRRLLAYLDDSKNIGNIAIYEVKEDERQRSDLLSYRHYGTHELSWVVLIAAGLDDACTDLPVGYELELPPASVVREMIRDVKGLESIG